MEMRNQEHQEVLVSKGAQRAALQMHKGAIGGAADHDHGMPTGHIARPRPILPLATVVQPVVAVAGLEVGQLVRA